MIYEYKCEKCQDIIEIEHSIKDSPNIFCAVCKSQRHRLCGGTFILKGEGWFKDGYSSCRDTSEKNQK